MVLAPPSLSSGVDADEAFSYAYRGQLAEEITYRQVRRDSPVNPGNRLLKLRELTNRVVADLELRGSLGGVLDAVIRDRGFYLVEPSDTGSFHNTLEEGYLALRLGTNVFVEAGKRSLPEGVGYAFNPVDFLSAPSDLPGADPDPAQFKQHRPGHYLLRLRGEAGPFSASVVYSPQLDDVDSRNINRVDQLLLKVYALMRGHDVSVYLYHGTRWAGGATWATVLGQALEVHGEASLQRGSDTRVPMVTGSPTDALVRFAPREEDDLVARILIGGHYTFPNGVNVVAEYFYDGEGYSRSEFTRYFRLLDAAALDVSPRGVAALGHAARNLEAARGQHFLFARVSDVRLPLNLQLTVFDMLNLEDWSNLASTALSRSWGNIKGMVAYDAFIGRRHSQFGSLPVGSQFRLVVQYSF